MKLIINIPEGEYGTIKQFEKLGKYSDKSDVGQRALSRIANGIPLEQIKDEIDKQAWAIAISDTDRANGMWDAYRIIDKYR